jgi:hypothetical protein
MILCARSYQARNGIMEIINPHELTSRIGLVAAGWARFEYLANQLIWRLANVDIAAGACITAQIVSAPNRLKALGSLVHLRGGSEELLKDLGAFITRAEGIGRQRNRIVHDPWIVEGEKSLRVEVTTDKKQLTFKVHDTSMAEMDELSKKVTALINDLHSLERRIDNELPVWPDKQYRESLDKDPTVAHFQQGFDQE